MSVFLCVKVSNSLNCSSPVHYQIYTGHFLQPLVAHSFEGFIYSLHICHIITSPCSVAANYNNQVLWTYIRYLLRYYHSWWLFHCAFHGLWIGSSHRLMSSVGILRAFPWKVCLAYTEINSYALSDKSDQLTHWKEP